jgi:cell division protein FtsI/penicillin-binding protein 2
MRMIKLLLCAAVVLLLAACAAQSAPKGYDISAYISAFESMDFNAMWDQVSPDAKADKEAFLSKYKDIFTGMGIQEVAVDNLSGPDTNGVYTYTATYKTKDYGDFTNDYTLTARPDEAGNGKVMWDYSLIFPEMEAGSSVRVETEKASRGEIFAADGTLLARNSFADTVYLDTTKVKDIAAAAAAASPVTGLSEADITEKYNKAKENSTKIVTLGAYPLNKLTDAQKQSILSVEGLGIDNEMYTPIRDYPLGATTSHMVGYVGYPKDSKVKAGLSGLEAAYEEQLKGKDGKIIYIEDKWGKNIRTLWEEKMQEGEDLRLTIKTDLQIKAFNALYQNLDYKKGQSGVAIVLDAASGNVEAMASYPSFDNNLFSFPLSDETWNTLQATESNHPLIFRATQGQYPPGSVIKPFTAAAALEAGAITPDTTFDGMIEDNKWLPTEAGWDGSKITRVSDSGTPLQLHNGLVNSDNIYFAFIALKLGAESFAEYMERVGMGAAVPFDLPVKEAQIINTGEKMTRSRLADSGYGQGQLLVTPLQIAAMYTAFANGTGNMMRPVLVEKLCRSDGLDYSTVSEAKPSVWINGAVKQSTLDTLTPILHDVVESGTGQRARVNGVSIAGKTGTAEIGNDKSREISWFAGYWMDGTYDRLVVVMVDVATEEGPVKFEIAKALLTP